MERRFERNDLVWAKLYGHPWWPAFVKASNKKGEYEVVFFGDFSRAFLAKSKLKPFEELRDRPDLSSKKLRASF